MDPGHDLDQGGLARAVLAEDRVYLAGDNLEMHILQRMHAAKGFRDMLHLDDRAAYRSSSNSLLG